MNVMTLQARDGNYVLLTPIGANRFAAKLLNLASGDELGRFPFIDDDRFEVDHPGDSAPTAWLTIERTSAEDVQHRELFASLDGRRIAIILFGDVATVAIAPGHHELRVHNTLSRKRAEFDAAPGQHVRFAAANVPSRGFAYWAFFIGAALMWTTLERAPDGEPPVNAVKETFRV